MKQSTLGETIEHLYQATARAFGTSIIFGGKTLPAMTSSLIKRAEHELLLENAGVNAAATDLRQFRVSPLEFIGIARPVPGNTLSWQGLSYTVLFVLADDLAGHPPVLLINCYRSPAPSADASDTAQLAAWPAPPA